MRKILTSMGLLAAVLALSACSEKPQEMGGTRSDAAPYTGVGQSQYQQPGWKAGDRGSWEQQLKARAQYGMNDYTRVATQ
jgi:predicted small lipoprotein YifL